MPGFLSSRNRALCFRFLANEAVSFLDGQSWSTKHEVLTRWGWIKRHNELLKDGIKLAAPYSCSLVPKGATYEQDDEEFYQGQPFGGGRP